METPYPFQEIHSNVSYSSAVERSPWYLMRAQYSQRVCVWKKSVKVGVFLGCFLCLGGKERRIFVTAFKYSLISSAYWIPGCATYLPLM